MTRVLRPAPLIPEHLLDSIAAAVAVYGLPLTAAALAKIRRQLDEHPEVPLIPPSAEHLVTHRPQPVRLSAEPPDRGTDRDRE